MTVSMLLSDREAMSRQSGSRTSAGRCLRWRGPISLSKHTLMTEQYWKRWTSTYPATFKVAIVLVGGCTRLFCLEIFRWNSLGNFLSKAFVDEDGMDNLSEDGKLLHLISPTISCSASYNRPDSYHHHRSATINCSTCFPQPSVSLPLQLDVHARRSDCKCSYRRQLCVRIHHFSLWIRQHWAAARDYCIYTLWVRI